MEPKNWFVYGSDGYDIWFVEPDDPAYQGRGITKDRGKAEILTHEGAVALAAEMNKGGGLRTYAVGRLKS